MAVGVLPFILSSFDPFKRNGSLAGFIVLGIGLSILLWCVQGFCVSRKGTLAPWDPPKKLMTIGLY